MEIYGWAILVSLVVYIAVGNYAGRRVKHLEDYFVAGRQAPTLLIVGTLVASYLSTNTFLAETGMAYSYWAGPWLLVPPITAMGYVYGSLFFGRYLRRSRALTVAEYLGARFASPRLRALAGITIILGLGGYLLAVTQGAALLLSQVSPLGYSGCLLIAWVTYTLFTLYSGSKGVVLTDTLMFLLFTSVSFVSLFFIVAHHGTWPEVFTQLATLPEKPDLMAWHGMVAEGRDWEVPGDLLTWNIIMGFAWGMVVAISPWQSSRYLMAKNEQVVIRSAFIAAVCLVSISMFLLVAAVTVNLSKSDIDPQEQTMIWAAMNILPPFLGALFLAGIMSAALSSASTFLSLVGFAVSNDVSPVMKIYDEATSRFSRLAFSRIVMLVVGAVVLVIALSIEPNIFWLTYFAGTVFASSWGPLAFMSIWSRTITEAGAFWGMLAGFFANVIPKLFATLGLVSLPTMLDPVIIGTIASVLTITIVSKRTSVTAEQAAYRERLHETPPEDYDPVETRRTHWVVKLLAVYGVLVTGLILTYYVAPYQNLTNPDAPFDWLTGESLYTLGWIAVCGFSAFVGHRVLMRHLAGKPLPVSSDDARV